MTAKRVLIGVLVAVVLGTLLAGAVPDRWWYGLHGSDEDQSFRDYTGIGQ